MCRRHLAHPSCIRGSGVVSYGCMRSQYRAIVGDRWTENECCQRDLNLNLEGVDLPPKGLA